MSFLTSVGWFLLVGAGFRGALGAVTIRQRRRTGEGSVEQAKRGTAIYGTAAVVGLLLLVIDALS